MPFSPHVPHHKIYLLCILQELTFSWDSQEGANREQTGWALFREPPLQSSKGGHQVNAIDLVCKWLMTGTFSY